MAEQKFAFESEEVSIAFTAFSGLGDVLIARKVFDALVELAPQCKIDFACVQEVPKTFVKAFYGDSKNLNKIIRRDEIYIQIFQEYDLTLQCFASHAVLLEWVNIQRLQTMAPKLLESVKKINDYNEKNIFGRGDIGLDIAFRNMMTAKILGKNIFFFMSCGGALPIYDDKVNIPLLPEYKSQFDNLKLGNYITIYSDIQIKNQTVPKVKTWSIRYLHEYVARMKKRFPAVEIVQCGGGGDIKIENADRHFLGVDLELTKYILANSLLHVGCEGGLVHLATAMGTKCLVLFGSSGADYYGYDRNINLVSGICDPCMFILRDYGYVCLRGANEPPCMLYHTPQTVCEVTCNYLKHLDLKN